MDIQNAFADPEAEKEGVWIDYLDGSRVKIARAGNPNFQRSYDAALKPHIRKQREGTLATEIELKCLCEAMAGTILMDWEGFTDGGKALKFDKKVAVKLLINHIDFRTFVADNAAEGQNFFAEVSEEAEKNS
tara:strand:+ start:223 stop:618 length:396 start_codon:yes stop_codon:yes gene_type:complete